MTADWRTTVKLRMRLLDETQTTLAKKLGVTRAAVSHVLTKANQSSLVPDINRALGIGTKKIPTDANDPVLPLQQWPDIEADGGATILFGRPRFEELKSIYFDLSDFSRGQLIERARALLEAQRFEQRHNSALAFLRWERLTIGAERLLRSKDPKVRRDIAPDSRARLTALIERDKREIARRKRRMSPADVAEKERSEEAAWNALDEIEGLLNAMGIPAATLLDKQWGDP